MKHFPSFKSPLDAVSSSFEICVNPLVTLSGLFTHTVSVSIIDPEIRNALKQFQFCVVDIEINANIPLI